MDSLIRRAVEHELYSLPRLRARLKNLNLDLIDHPRPDTSDGSKSNLPGDPVGSAAARELDIKSKIAVLETRIQKIENALEALKEEDRQLIELRYLSPHHYSNDYVKDTLMVSQTRYYIWREEVLQTIAEIIGLTPGL